MPVSDQDFINAIRDFQVSMSTDVDAYRKRIVLDGATSLVRETPVESGNARFNYVVTPDQPFDSVLDYDKDQVIWEDKSNLPPLRIGGLEPLARALGDIADINPDTPVVWVTNNVDYIEELENGYSKQGAHMLDLTVQYLLHKYPDLSIV